MLSRGLFGACLGLLVIGCDPAGRHSDHPDDPVNHPRSPASPREDVAPPAPVEPESSGPGEAYTQARKLDLVREAVPCPDDCARGQARVRCGVAANIRFLDLVAQGSHRNVREVLERTPGISACFDAIADAGAKRLPSFRIPLDFMIGPTGRLQSRENPLHDPDAGLERMLGCVGTWLDGLTFDAAGRPLRARARLQVEPTAICRAEH